MSVYYDYRLKFPQTGLAEALSALAALQAAGILAGEDIPANMLGDPRDAAGAVAAEAPAWRGSPGGASLTYQQPDPVTGDLVDVTASSDPTCYYIHIRTTVPPTALPFDPADYGMTPVSEDESAAVLGVWA